MLPGYPDTPIVDETIPPPETFHVDEPVVGCQGAGGVLGHPLVYLKIGASGFADCGYCDRRYILAGGPADLRAEPGTAATLAPGILPHVSDAH